MADLRVLLAAALNSSDLSPSDVVETHVDRIGALAFADPLGGALWALKYAGEPRAYPRALALLSARSKRAAHHRGLRERLCSTVLQEWMYDQCAACGGRSTLAATQIAPVRACTVCNGTGRRRHSDLWRMRQMKMEAKVYRKWEAKFVAVHHKISDADARAWADIAQQLGRAPARLLRETLDHAFRREAIIATNEDGLAQNENFMPRLHVQSSAAA